MDIPAFPTIDANTNGGDYGTPGMTLRDYFAAKALAGMLANSSIDALKPEEFSSDAYLYADAMLKKRESK